MIRIVVRKGGLAGKSFEFRRDSIHIGRADGNDLVLPDEWISSHHARIAISGERYILQDLRSTNGTFMVYGETRTRLEQGQTQELLADNTVQFGSKDSIVEMSIQVIEDDDRDGAGGARDPSRRGTCRRSAAAASIRSRAMRDARRRSPEHRRGRRCRRGT